MPRRPAAPQPDTLKVEPSNRQSPQVVTVVHRLNGIKALALLRRAGEKVTEVDDDLLTAPNAVTIITAGFALGDGQSIVARLPQAEAEVDSLLAPPDLKATAVKPMASVPPVMPTTPAGGQRIWGPPTASGFIVVQSNGRQFAARYIGLDGGSGLSLLRISGLKANLTKDADEAQLAVGQTVRILAPDRFAHVSGAASSTVALHVSEIEGKITEIARTSAGKIAHITIRAENLSPAIVGGVALNAAGEAVGIVETSSAGTARLIPTASVRRAAERVLERQASVPRPWLGVRGEAVATTPLEKFYSSGWTAVEAAAVKRYLEGVLLTSVAPGTPAALANLRPGDVIARVNNFAIKNAEDFSYVLNEAGGGSTVNFTVYRGQNAKAYVPFIQTTPPAVVEVPQPSIPQAPFNLNFNMKPFDVNVRLGESLNPAFTMKLAEERRPELQMLNPFPLVARGIETAMLSQRAATHLG
ncbi:MAG: S1C family serine protease, partial [Acidobacteriota bacterium]|nr:S1C family serine protease [Acidobacteriota bacterium]